MSLHLSGLIITMRQRINSLMLPIAILGGIVFHNWIDYLTPLSLLLIFCMLTITYCRIKPSDLRLRKYHWVLLVTQLGLSAVTYFLLLPIDSIVASGVFICVFIPTATAAPVVARMLGGDVTAVAIYSLLCNIVVALIAPIILAAIGEHPEMNFIESLLYICKKVIPLLICPMLIAFAMRKLTPKVHNFLANHQSASFYLWSVALFIVIGSSVSFVIKSFTWDIATILLGLSLGSLVVCIIQFYIGKRLGVKYGDPVSGAQSFAQKNTILAIWMCLTYLNPLASIGPATYMAWHNLFNSWQIMRHKQN